MTSLNLDNLAPSVAILKPTLVGAAFRIFLLGGSALTEKERVQASGSGYLMNQNGGEIMALVAELERRVTINGATNG